MMIIRLYNYLFLCDKVFYISKIIYFIVVYQIMITFSLT
jgi:hypothetical protein